MIFNFGKYKGKTLEEIGSTENGRSYLEWIIKQPLEKNEYYERNKARNDEIASYLNSLVNGNKNIDDLQIINNKLDQILDILTKDGNW